MIKIRRRPTAAYVLQMFHMVPPQEMPLLYRHACRANGLAGFTWNVLVFAWWGPGLLVPAYFLAPGIVCFCWIIARLLIGSLRYVASVTLGPRMTSRLMTGSAV